MVAFILLLGTQSFRKELGQVEYVCPGCGRNAWQRLVRTRQWLTLFFIPVFPLGRTTLAACSACGYAEEVDEAHALRMLEQQRNKPSPPPYR